MSSTTSSQGTAGSAPSPHQDRLINFCRQQGARTPNFQIVSDRRGGRTAWSCVVTVQGAQVPARFWYDGQYVNNAREDAAEKALQMLGVLPTPQSQPPAHLRDHQYYGMINS
ncbi:hypothetical protein Slin15195_G076340 [Septoria linicola]|uniref:DRBM domain-containing protein n=1 Tax=Septoria linicola TaxID=215465 RepID=A0A9Q9EKR2_9PEZI|nr:hypothetical protein Slin14017_G037450 [Septoria linicola]USW54315.1 hypothetical protein Slin15195_G076340 [Septoria linicola]